MKTKKMTNKQVVELGNSMIYAASVTGKSDNYIKYLYAVKRTTDGGASQLKAISESYVLPESYQAYEKERIALAESFAKKDASGKPIIKDDAVGNKTYDIFLEDGTVIPEFTEKFEALKETHKEALKEFKDMEDKYNYLLGEETEVAYYPISLAHIPDNFVYQIPDNPKREDVIKHQQTLRIFEFLVNIGIIEE